jgi:hypothetical protein
MPSKSLCFCLRNRSCWKTRRLRVVYQSYVPPAPTSHAFRYYVLVRPFYLFHRRAMFSPPSSVTFSKKTTSQSPYKKVTSLTLLRTKEKPTCSTLLMECLLIPARPSNMNLSKITTRTSQGPSIERLHDFESRRARGLPGGNCTLVVAWSGSRYVT